MRSYAGVAVLHPAALMPGRYNFVGICPCEFFFFFVFFFFFFFFFLNSGSLSSPSKEHPLILRQIPCDEPQLIIYALVGGEEVPSAQPVGRPPMPSSPYASQSSVNLPDTIFFGFFPPPR